MLASGVYFADVDLAEAGAEGFQHEVGLGHGAVDLFGVADVEAEGCPGEIAKDVHGGSGKRNWSAWVECSTSGQNPNTRSQDFERRNGNRTFSFSRNESRIPSQRLPQSTTSGRVRHPPREYQSSTLRRNRRLPCRSMARVVPPAGIRSRTATSSDSPLP